ncbi:ABC transporter ATP-binding protein [Arthrobacter sp. UM1]|uniref:ABC transporter ATP-binding protein n=1 Tax=Arthrobacter sp. UM1 TaxID=2766776 RepID=UPI001CF65779|nr:ABC transporter ATP-binding protein [Arthrobacter sp. UM1]MCB4207820.1 ABC transporter ATP-binding protein [Arthrobacter sp. UM1]
MTDHAPAPALRAESLTLAWDRRTVLEDVTLDIPTGRFTAVIGPNGYGKSTLLKAFARILTPVSGTALLHGDDLRRLSAREAARRLALLPQGATTPQDITVFELVSRGRHPHQTFLSQWGPDDEAAVTAALDAAGVASLQEERVQDLSGGQRQRVWMAMVLAQQTDTILLDEPTTFLDIAHQYALLELVRALSADQGRTCVAVLHDLQQAARYADHLVVLARGGIHAVGTPHEVLTDTLLRDVFEIDARVLPDPETGDRLIIPRRLSAPDVSMLERPRAMVR